MNATRWIIQQVGAQKLSFTPTRQNVKQAKVLKGKHDFSSTLPKDSLIPGGNYNLVMARGKNYATYVNKEHFGEVNKIVVQKRSTDSSRRPHKTVVWLDNGWANLIILLSRIRLQFIGSFCEQISFAP